MHKSILENHNGNAMRVAIAETEKNMISMALIKCYGNQSEASRVLGINRNTLDKKMRKLGMKK